MIKKYILLATLTIATIGFASAAFAQSIKLNVPLPGGGPGGGTLVATNDLGPYINAIFTFGTGFVISISIVMIMIAGVRWLTSGGNATRINAAKSDIITYIIGISIAMFSYYILFLINPDLTVLRSPNVRPATVEKFSGFGTDFTVETGFADDGKRCEDKSECQSGICYEYADGKDDGVGTCVSSFPAGAEIICEDSNIDRNAAFGVGIGADDDITCPEGQFCYDPGIGDLATCVSGIPLNKLCGELSSYPNRDCETGLICYSPTSTCRPPGGIGASCNSDVDCASKPTLLVCNTYILRECKPLGDIGDGCNKDRECKSGLYCETEGRNSCQTRP